MSQDLERRWGEEHRVHWVGGADCRGHDCCAGAGSVGERGSWVSGAEAHGSVQGLRVQVAGAQAPGGRKIWPPSCGGG